MTVKPTPNPSTQTQLPTTHPGELFHITYKANNEEFTLVSTGEHPFWVSDKGWVTARQLSIDDDLQLAKGTNAKIVGIETEKGEFTTYNFEVADNHTYFVLPEGKSSGDYSVFVHNACATKGKKLVNANRRGSQREQHGYYIREIANPNNVRKVGVSSGKIRKGDGKSYRAEKQVRERNAKAGFDKYESVIMGHIPKGTNARGKILDWEEAHSLINIKTLDPLFHRRPWPKQ